MSQEPRRKHCCMQYIPHDAWQFQEELLFDL